MAGNPLAGQVALVTGGAKRIGRSIALRLAEDGADIALNFRSSHQEATATAGEIESRGRRCLLLQADVTSLSAVHNMMDNIREVFGQLDILVNNAGTFSAADVRTLSEDQWDFMLNVNLKSQFLCAQAAIPLMERAGRGHIINISSIGGLLPWSKFTHYCVSKAASIMLTRCLARALGPNIMVNSVAPGTIQFEGEPPDEDYIRRVPVQRVGRGEEIAAAVSFLVQSSFITGQVIVVDGGRTLV
jgi:3-oxoacyl-[acyl-carrier protein] reductase/pteridine reductase